MRLLVLVCACVRSSLVRCYLVPFASLTGTLWVGRDKSKRLNTVPHTALDSPANVFVCVR